jgi:hypothetical protein
VTEKGREQFEAALGFIEDVLQALRSSLKGTGSV